MGMKYEKIVVEIIISLGTVLQWGKPSQWMESSAVYLYDKYVPMF
jgi:hypothetical protein